MQRDARTSDVGFRARVSSCVVVVFFGTVSAVDTSSADQSSQRSNHVGAQTSWVRANRTQAALNIRGTATMNAVVAVGTSFVAVGEAGSEAGAWTSVDGLTWRRATVAPSRFPASQRQVITDLVVGSAGLVAVGFEALRDDGTLAAAWTSDDGARWQRVPDAVAGGNAQRYEAMTGVAAGELGFAAAGWSHPGQPDAEPRAAFWTSRDGASWRRVPDKDSTLGAGGWVGDLAAGRTGFVATSSDHRAEDGERTSGRDGAREARRLDRRQARRCHRLDHDPRAGLGRLNRPATARSCV